MKTIIPPVDKALLQAELTEEFFVRPTHKANNLIYDLTAYDAPNVMREIARLREISYRQGGGSTGEAMDIDDLDTNEQHPYRQIVVWDPDNQQIVGGYRYLCCKDCGFREDGQPYITSAHLFYYTPYFIKDYLPYTIELGRAFVQPAYQQREMGVKALYALDNLWDGIGAVLCDYPEIKYLIGKVTIYPAFDADCRNLIYAYLSRYHMDRKGLFRPYNPVEISVEGQEWADEIFIGEDPVMNFHILQRAVRSRETVIPPMFSAYLNLTDHLLFFGNAVNDELANVYETGIMVQVDQINPAKRERYMDAYWEFLKKKGEEFIRIRQERRLERQERRANRRLKRTILREEKNKNN